MITQKEAEDLFKTLSKTTAMSLRTLADQLDKIKSAGELSQVAGKTHEIAFLTLNYASDWMNQERKG